MNARSNTGTALLISTVAVAMLAGCKNEAKPGVDDLAAAIEETHSVYCECAEIFDGYDALDICDGEFEFATECVEAVWNSSAGAAAFFECQVEAYEDWAVCASAQQCSTFTCDDGEEIMGLWQCDGAPDCAGGEDELGCEGSCSWAWESELLACSGLTEQEQEAYEACLTMTSMGGEL